MVVLVFVHLLVGVLLCLWEGLTVLLDDLRALVGMPAEGIVFRCWPGLNLIWGYGWMVAGVLAL